MCHSPKHNFPKFVLIWGNCVPVKRTYSKSFKQVLNAKTQLPQIRINLGKLCSREKDICINKTEP